jgi:hypothetical protein
MLLCFGVRPLLSFLGTIAFAFTSYNIILLQAGHNTKISAIGLGCMIIGGLFLVLNNRRLLGFAVLGIGVFLNLFVFHVQISFYLALGIVPMYLYYTINKIQAKKWDSVGKDFVVILLAVTLGIGSVIGKYLITKEYTTYSIRGIKELTPVGQKPTGQVQDGLDKDYAFSWSQGIHESLTLLIPDLYGSSSAEKPVRDGAFVKALTRVAGRQQAEKMAEQKMAPYYHGDQPFTSGPIYAGAVLLFLAILCLVKFKEYRIWVIAGIIITLIISWGRNLEFINYFLFDHLPLFNKFRSVSMAQSITVALVALSAFVFLNYQWKNPKWFLEKKELTIPFYVLGGICVLYILFPGLVSVSTPNDAAYVKRLGIPDQSISTFVNALEDDRKSLIRSSAIRSLVFLSITFGALWFAMKEKLKLKTAIIVLGVCAVIDVVSIALRFVKPSDFNVPKREIVVRASEADKVILKDESGGRVLNLGGNTFNEANTAYFHEGIGGYSPAKIQRYQDLIERRITPELGVAVEQLRQGRTNLVGTPTLNMLNTKFLKFGDEANRVAVNENALGRTWFIEEIKPVGSADEEIAALAGFDPARTAIMDTSKFKMADRNYIVSPEATANYSDFNNNNITIEVNNSRDGFLVLSEIFYPIGWEATIDGQEAEIKRVNYVLRGIDVPANSKEIKLSFYPKDFKTYEVIQSTSSTLLLILSLVAFGLTIYRMNQGKPIDPALLSDR